MHPGRKVLQYETNESLGYHLRWVGYQTRLTKITVLMSNLIDQFLNGIYVIVKNEAHLEYLSVLSL